MCIDATRTRDGFTFQSVDAAAPKTHLHQVVALERQHPGSKDGPQDIALIAMESLQSREGWDHLGGELRERIMT